MGCGWWFTDFISIPEISGLTLFTSMCILPAQLSSQSLWLARLWNKVFHLGFKLLLTLQEDIYYKLPKYLLTLIYVYTVWCIIFKLTGHSLASSHVVNNAFSSSVLSNALCSLCGNHCCTNSLWRHTAFSHCLLSIFFHSLRSPSLYPYHIIYCISHVHFGIMFGPCAPYFFLILSHSSPALFPPSPFLSDKHTHTHTHLLTDWNSHLITLQ